LPPCAAEHLPPTAANKPNKAVPRVRVQCASRRRLLMRGIHRTSNLPKPLLALSLIWQGRAGLAWLAYPED
jgi:hypothetical protein